MFPAYRPAWAALLLVAMAAGHAQTRCLDEDAPEPQAPREAAAPPPDPRATLAVLVGEALKRSHAVGAAQLLAEAARADVDEARAATALQASATAGIGPNGERADGITETNALQARTGITLGQTLWDGGRSQRLVDWRMQLAESARFGQLSQQEQIALTTVSLALERSRFRSTVLVWRSHVRKMGCLVEALETITRTDRGRASELAQAKKSLQQAELQLAQTQSAVRQVDVRLRRLVGDGLPGTEGLATVFAAVPELPQLVADAERSWDIAQLDAQIGAANRYAEAVVAGGKPQVSWSASAGVTAAAGGKRAPGTYTGVNKTGSYAVALAVSIPLLSPGLGAATDAARKRAQAAALQRADALEARRFRVAEVWEQSQSAVERARRTVEVLRDSDQVRSFTLQQWQQLGRRSLFDVMSAEAEHYNLRVSYVNALHDQQQLNANLLSLGRGVLEWLR